MSQKKTTKPRPKPARAVREYTAGGVVFRHAASGDIEFLMIQDAKNRWTVPKGHVEDKESLEQTALREVGEETGLKKLKIRDKLDKIHFFYRREGKLIFMTTYIFLMEAMADSDQLVMGDSEGITDVKWFRAEEAIRLVEYRDTEKLFQLGLTKVKERDRVAK